MRFKSYPIFKVFAEPFEIINIPSRHNDEYLMIVDILNKRLISFDEFEITVKGYLRGIVPLLIINENSSFIVSWPIELCIVEFMVTKGK